MTRKKILTELKDLFHRVARKEGEEWLEKQPAWTGKLDGVTVRSSVPGKIWVRFQNGKELEVLNTLAPYRFDIQVKIGRNRIRPEVWQVIETREPWDTVSTGGAIPYHADQHMFDHEDMVPIDRRQILQMGVLVSDGAAFIVRVHGDLRITKNGAIKISSQYVNLFSYRPTTGARWVGIESSDAGVLSVRQGTNFSAWNAWNVSHLPVPPAGKHLRAWILLYEGQSALRNEHIFVPGHPDINPAQLVRFLDDLEDVNAPNPEDGQVLTWDEYSQEWIAADQTGGSPPLTQEQVEDIIGAMLSGNIETGITVSYDDTNGKIDFALVDEYLQDIAGLMFSGNTETGITATYQDADGTIDLEVSATSESNANDIFRCDSPGGVSLWTGTISGAPSGASVTVSAPTSGTEGVLVPASTSQLAKMRVYNLTRGNSALISDYNTGTNVMTLTANAPANWASGDSLTVVSQTVSGGGFDWVDLEITSGPTNKVHMFFFVTIIPGAAGNAFRFHPFETFGAGKVQSVTGQVAGTAANSFVLVKITNNVFSVAWGGSPTAILARETGYLY